MIYRLQLGNAEHFNFKFYLCNGVIGMVYAKFQTLINPWNMADINQIHVRPAVPQDIPRLADFFRKNVEEHSKFDPYFVLAPQFDAAALLERAIKTPDVLLLVAEKSPEIVGYIFFRISNERRARAQKSILLRLAGRLRQRFGAPAMFKPYRVGFISDCYVEPAYRQQGVGNLLLAKGLAWLSAQNVAHIELEAYVGNAGAVKFWQSHGFETIKLKMRRELKR